MLTQERDQKTKEILAKIEDLPVLPLAAKDIVTITATPDCSVEQIAKAIDPSLAIKILQVANSPYYRRVAKVKNLEHAISLLGFNVVRDLALGISLINIFPRHKKGPFNYEKFWRHTLLIAGTSKILARTCNFREISKVYTAALVHNIGKIVIGLFMPHDLKKIGKLIKAKGMAKNEAEKVVLGMSHAEVGGILAEKWGLPEDFVKVIRHHNDPKGLKEDPELIQLCELIDYSAKIVNELNIPHTKDMIEKMDQLFERIVKSIREVIDIKEIIQKDKKIIVEDWESRIHQELEEFFQTVEGIISVLITSPKTI